MINSGESQQSVRRRERPSILYLTMPGSEEKIASINHEIVEKPFRHYRFSGLKIDNSWKRKGLEVRLVAWAEERTGATNSKTEDRTVGSHIPALIDDLEPKGPMARVLERREGWKEVISGLPDEIRNDRGYKRAFLFKAGGTESEEYGKLHQEKWWAKLPHEKSGGKTVH